MTVKECYEIFGTLIKAEQGNYKIQVEIYDTEDGYVELSIGSKMIIDDVTEIITFMKDEVK